MDNGEFLKIMADFVSDLKITFPEYTLLLDKMMLNPASLYEFCKQKYPPRFFDIMYKNESLFSSDNSDSSTSSFKDTELLPCIHFCNLWNDGISSTTKETIWKYLQLILFTVVGSLDAASSAAVFGDTAKLFEAISPEEFSAKLGETLNSFDQQTSGDSDDDSEEPKKMFNEEEMNEHINKLVGGKIGQLAQEIAEETAKDLGMEFSDATDMKDIFTRLIRTPSKLMDLVKNISSKIGAKLESGELKESEMLQEATDIMTNMKNIPGMGSILNQMGLGGKKVNMAATEAQMKQRMKLAKTKERIRAKAEAVAAAKAAAAKPVQPTAVNMDECRITEEELIKMFESDSKPAANMKKKKHKKK